MSERKIYSDLERIELTAFNSIGQFANIFCGKVYLLFTVMNIPYIFSGGTILTATGNFIDSAAKPFLGLVVEYESPSGGEESRTFSNVSLLTEKFELSCFVVRCKALNSQTKEPNIYLIQFNKPLSRWFHFQNADI